MPRQLNAGYTAFYKKVALYPEVGRYRRFAANWSKRLYDDTEEVVQKEYAVNKALEAKRRPGCGVTILDVPRSIAIEENPEIQREWDDYEDALTKHGMHPLHLFICRINVYLTSSRPKPLVELSDTQLTSS